MTQTGFSCMISKRKMIMTMNGRVVALVLLAASWGWCEPVIGDAMKIIHELRAECFSKLRRASFVRNCHPLLCAGYRALCSVPYEMLWITIIIWVVSRINLRPFIRGGGLLL